MALAVALCVLVSLSGFGLLRVLGLTKAFLAIGLSPAAGLATLFTSLRQRQQARRARSRLAACR
jgi:hypothetical protein